MPRPRAVECHAACYSLALCWRMPRACPVEAHVAGASSGKREPPRDKPVASGEAALAAVATNVNLHGTSPWHLSKPFRNGVKLAEPDRTGIVAHNRFDAACVHTIVVLRLCASRRSKPATLAFSTGRSCAAPRLADIAPSDGTGSKLISLLRPNGLVRRAATFAIMPIGYEKPLRAQRVLGGCWLLLSRRKNR